MDPSPSPAKPWEIGRNAQAAGAAPRTAPPKPWANRTAGAGAGAQPPRPIGAATSTLPSATAAAAGSVPLGGAASSITRPGARPWERPGVGTTAYGQRTPVGATAYSSTAANRPYGSAYGGGYSTGYGTGYSTGYGAGYGNSYGGGMYGNSYGGGMYGGGGVAGNEMEQIYGQQGEPGAWSFLESVQNIVHAFGHLSWLLQGNFEALHMFFGSFFGLTERVGHFTSELLGMLRTIAFFKYLYDLVRSFFGRPRSTIAPLPSPLPHPRPALPPNTQ